MMDDTLAATVDAALAELRRRLEDAGMPVAALGLSVFVVSPEPHSTLECSAFGGDVALVGMFAPEWPFQLSADLSEEPTARFEAAHGEIVN